MYKEDILKEVLSTDYTKLVPAAIFNGEVYTLTVEEFKQLSKHMNVSDKEYNIIKIFNIVFVRESVGEIRSNKLNELGI